MNRSPPRLLIAVALAGYGIYAASYVPAMLVGTSVPACLVSSLLAAVRTAGSLFRRESGVV